MDDSLRQPLIVARDLRVRYGDRWALEGLSFEVAAGELVGLIGPNGAGKTTAMSVLATLRRPDAGAAEIAGHDAVRDAGAARRALGYVPQNLAVYPTLTARENAVLFARLFGLRGRAVRDAAGAALALVGLEERADDVVSTFSGGMQRRLNLACGLLHRPRVLLLDEPTVGVDPQSRERIFEAVQAQAGSAAAVLYSTHYMEEAERLCDRVLLVDGGRVVAAGTPAALIDEAGGGMRLEVSTRSPLPGGWLEGLEAAPLLAPAEDHVVGFRTRIALGDLTAASAVLDRAAAHGGGVLDFHLHQPGLQEVFLRLTGHDLRD
ncbi:MAG TPA: ABC transporter ATP-binding protein [Candidatus Dormibacteraeota bacterium]|nr:ABC transporter ATP-binding protein [Candidatus Dormibacteraeota bacterium]